jgi:hypothetical protein
VEQDKYLYLLLLSGITPCFFLYFRCFSPADTAPFISTPLAGETVGTWLFLRGADTFRLIDHSPVIRQFLKTHFSTCAVQQSSHACCAAILQQGRKAVRVRNPAGTG